MSAETFSNNCGETSNAAGSRGEPARLRAPIPTTLAESIVRCTVCRDQINVNIRCRFGAHPELGVIMCKRCLKFLSKGEWKTDQDGADDFCTWCGQGGDIYVCDVCNKRGFCKNCLRRNFGRRYADAAAEQTWWCFICDPNPLFPLQEQYKSFVAKLDKKKANGRANRSRVALDIRSLTPSTADVTTRSMEGGTTLKSEDSSKKKKTEKIKTLSRLMRTAKSWSVEFQELMEKMQQKLNSVLDSASVDMHEKLTVSQVIVEDLRETIGSVKKFCEQLEESLNGNILVRVGTSDDGARPTVAWVPKPEGHEHDDGRVEETESGEDCFVEYARVKRPRSSERKPPKKKRRMASGEGTSSVASRKSTHIVQDLKEIYAEEAHLDQQPWTKIIETVENGKDLAISGSSGPKASASVDGGNALAENMSDDGTACSSDQVSCDNSLQSAAIPAEETKLFSAKEEHDCAVSIDYSKMEDAEERLPSCSLHSALSNFFEDAESDVGCVASSDQSPMEHDSAGNTPSIDWEEESPQNNISKESDNDERAASGDDCSKISSPMLSDRENTCEESEGSPQDHARDEIDEERNRENDGIEGFCSNNDGDWNAPSTSDNGTGVVPLDGEENDLGTSRSAPSPDFEEDSVRDAVLKEFANDIWEEQANESNSPQCDASVSSDAEEIDDVEEVNLQDSPAYKIEKARPEDESDDLRNDGDKSDSDLGSASNQPKKNRAETEDGFDPEMEKQIQALKRSLRHKTSDRNSPPLSAKPRSKIKKDMGAPNPEESSSSDVDESADVQEAADKDEQEKPSLGFLKVPDTNLSLMESSSARDAVMAELANDPDVSSSSSSDEELENQPPSTKKKTVKPPRDDEDGQSLVELSSDTDDDEAADMQPKSKREIKRERLLRRNFFRPDGVKTRERTSDDVRTRATSTTEKRHYRFLSSSDDEESSSSASIYEPASDETDTDDSDCIELTKCNEESRQETKRDRPKAMDKVKEELSLSQGSAGSGTLGSPVKGSLRRNIRPVMAGSLSTLEAQAAEEDRKRRVAQLQSSQSTSQPPDVAVADTVTAPCIVLDEKADPVVKVHSALATQLKPHQVDGVKFLYSSTIESVTRKDEPGDGCILAHCMGLGKTFQVISYLHAIMLHPALNFRTALVVTPRNVVLNWKDEFGKWLRNCPPLSVREILSAKTLNDRISVIEQWQRTGGVLIMGYTMFRNLAGGKTVKTNALKSRFASCLLDPGPDIVVCDEGHVLKNDTTGINVVMNRIRTKRRICLTGTPLQNHLTEYHCMVQFVKPDLLGTKKEFKNRFENPVKNGQCVDSTPSDIRLMKRRAHVLHSMLIGFVHRLDYSVLTAVLPPRYEFVLMVRLSEKQMQLYQTYLSNVVGGVDIDSLRARKQLLFADFHALQRVCTHPLSLKVHQEEYAQRRRSSFIEYEPAERELSTSDDDDSEPVDENGGITHGPGTSASVSASASGMQRPGRTTTPLESLGWWKSLVSEDDCTRLDMSGKLVLLTEIIWKCEQLGEKLLVFSQSLVTLDVIEQFLKSYETFIEACHSKTDGDKAHCEARRKWRWGWKLGHDYLRVDGQTSAQNRKKYIKIFNDEECKRCRLFLISTRAGGIGTNLIGANRVVIFDASWNPSNDAQAIFRVYRYGQTKNVYIYRFVSQGTMEDVIYDRQVTKQSLALRVVDEHQVGRHFSASDLEALYAFRPADAVRKDGTSIVAVPKDHVLADLLLDQKQWLITYHEHDSLLRNLEDEKLTEDEKKAAWDEYDAEREGRKTMTLPPLMRCILAEPRIEHYVDLGNQIIRESDEPGLMTMEYVCQHQFETKPEMREDPSKLLEFLKAFCQDLVRRMENTRTQRQEAQRLAPVHQPQPHPQSTTRNEVVMLPTRHRRTLPVSNSGSMLPPYGGVYGVPSFNQLQPTYPFPFPAYGGNAGYVRLEAPLTLPQQMNQAPY